MSAELRRPHEQPASVEPLSVQPEQKRHSEMWRSAGEPPRGALLERTDAGERRKEVCEDQKISDPEHGVFGIFDGVSTGDGATASRMVARDMYAMVASDTVAQHLEALRSRPSADADRKIDVYMQQLLQRATAHADRALESVNTERRAGQYKASTTMSFGMKVRMHDGRERLYYVQSGDSRIALLRHGELRELTEDESMAGSELRRLVKDGQLVQSDAEAIEQAPSFEAVPDRLKPYAKRFFGPNKRTRNIISGSVGAGEHARRPITVQSRELLPGDTLVFTSDGIHDNLLNTEIADVIQQGGDVADMERRLLDAAEMRAQEVASLSREERSWVRTKGSDDVSAIVVRIEGRPVVDEAPTVIDTPVVEPVSERHALIRSARERARLLADDASPTHHESSTDLQRASLEARLQHFEEQRERIAERLPPRFHVGMRVRMPDSSEQWPIASYDTEHNAYVFETLESMNPHAGEIDARVFQRGRRFVDRFALEAAQEEVFPLYPGVDVVTVVHQTEQKPVVYRDSQVAAVMGDRAMLTVPEGFASVPVEDVRRAVQAELAAGKQVTEMIERTRRELTALNAPAVVSEGTGGRARALTPTEPARGMPTSAAITRMRDIAKARAQQKKG